MSTTHDALRRLGWHHTRDTSNGVAADSEASEPGYVIEVHSGGGFTLWHNPEPDVTTPIVFPAGPLPTPLQAGGMHEEARHRQ